MLLGCIGDDFTGSSDVANTLAKNGMRTVQYTGVPKTKAADDVEAGVVALKSRTNDPNEAIRQSLEALDWLKEQGCEQFLFKYCSTFDSTHTGNIGPVADALADALKARKVIFCPVFPGAGRSIYMGHLFVNDVLLNESGMQNHPLTPMSDPDIRRWLKPQTKNEVGHVTIHDVFAGANRIINALEREDEVGNRFIIVDALRDEDLNLIGEAVADLPLITGGSGVAIGLPKNFIKQGKIKGGINKWNGESGKCVAIAGSVSIATRNQVEFHSKKNPSYKIIASEVIEGRLKPAEIVNWMLNEDGIPLAYSSADPIIVKQVQSEYGQEKSAEAIENFFAEIARQLVASGIKKILTAGGETSGAVITGLGLDTLEIGPEIDPGVPALRAGPNLVVALKSGNFGTVDYFEKAALMLGKDI